MSERGILAKCHIPPHTRLAPYLGVVCDAESRGPYCLHVKDAENELICLDAQSQLYDIGYLTHLSAYQGARAPAPPNYARFVNSLRPEQQTGDHSFNDILLPDPTEWFTWLTSGPLHIAADTEILVDYGGSFWRTVPILPELHSLTPLNLSSTLVLPPAS